jgi:hypothetical protein
MVSVFLDGRQDSKDEKRERNKEKKLDRAKGQKSSLAPSRSLHLSLSLLLSFSTRIEGQGSEENERGGRKEKKRKGRERKEKKRKGKERAVLIFSFSFLRVSDLPAAADERHARLPCRLFFFSLLFEAAQKASSFCPMSFEISPDPKVQRLTLPVERK